MALVKHLEKKHLESARPQGVVEASYSIVDIDDERFLQIDTYGSPDRQIPGKRSQSLRFGSAGIQELKRVLAEFE